MLFGKLERKQWPVGHGGLHTGKLQVGDDIFEYLYDCGALGAKGKDLIKKTVAGKKYDFAVLSHFDADHVASLASTAANTVFLPYATRSDVLLLVCAKMAAGATFRTAAMLALAIQELKSKKRIVWVRHEPPPEGEPVEHIMNKLPGGFAASGMDNIRTEHGQNVMSDKSVVTVKNTRAALLGFKFYNHRWVTLSDNFFNILHLMITTGHFVNDVGIKYRDLEVFLQDLESKPVEVIKKNRRELKNAYQKLLDAVRIASITSSNLSSLTLFSSPCMEDVDDDFSYTYGSGINERYRYHPRHPRCQNSCRVT